VEAAVGPSSTLERNFRNAPWLDAWLCRRSPSPGDTWTVECEGKRSATPLWNRWREHGALISSRWIGRAVHWHVVQRRGFDCGVRRFALPPHDDQRSQKSRGWRSRQRLGPRAAKQSGAAALPDGCILESGVVEGSVACRRSPAPQRCRRFALPPQSMTTSVLRSPAKGGRDSVMDCVRRSRAEPRLCRTGAFSNPAWWKDPWLAGGAPLHSGVDALLCYRSP
jgi:hypothetical protein